jgi:hypothetical protein
MPQPCTICHHTQLREITAALMARVPYREIIRRYSLSLPAINRHVKNHISKALRQLAAAEGMTTADAASIAAPVLGEMRKLNARALRILGDAEAAKDRPTALNAIRECRRNLELIARLTGELDPRTAGETPGAPLTVIVQYVEKQAIVANGQPQLTGGDPCPL